jgi:GPH family glycoside/pentoside/hexuronide:cation symporter
MQNTGNYIATGLGVVTGFAKPLLIIMSPAPAINQGGLLVVLIFSIITVLFYLPSIVWIRQKPDLVIPRRNLAAETAIVIRNRTYVGWMFAVGFLSFCFAAINAEIIGFAQKVLLLTSFALLLPPAISLLLGTIIFLFVWTKLIRRVGKGRSMAISMVFLALLLATTPFLSLLMPAIPNMIVAILFFIPVAACMAVYYLMSYLVPADIARVDEIETGQSRAGIYTGFIGVPINVFQAVSALLLGFIMDYSVAQYGSSVWGLMWWGPIYAPSLIVAAIILHYVNIDPDFKSLWAKKTGA